MLRTRGKFRHDVQLNIMNKFICFDLQLFQQRQSLYFFVANQKSGKVINPACEMEIVSTFR